VFEVPLYKLRSGTRYSIGFVAKNNFYWDTILYSSTAWVDPDCPSFDFDITNPSENKVYVYNQLQSSLLYTMNNKTACLFTDQTHSFEGFQWSIYNETGTVFQFEYFLNNRQIKISQKEAIPTGYRLFLGGSFSYKHTASGKSYTYQQNLTIEFSEEPIYIILEENPITLYFSESLYINASLS